MHICMMGGQAQKTGLRNKNKIKDSHLDLDMAHAKHIKTTSIIRHE